MRVRVHIAGLAAATLLMASAAAAEPLGSYFTLTPFAGYTTFDGNLLFPAGASPLKNDVYAGARFGWWSKRWFAVEGAAGFTPTRGDVAGGADVNFWHASGNL